MLTRNICLGWFEMSIDLSLKDNQYIAPLLGLLVVLS